MQTELTEKLNNKSQKVIPSELSKDVFQQHMPKGFTVSESA